MARLAPADAVQVTGLSSLVGFQMKWRMLAWYWATTEVLADAETDVKWICRASAAG